MTRPPPARAPERVDDYDYVVPPEAVAHVPAASRSDARLAVVERFAAGTDPADARIGDLPGLLAPGDLLVLNAARVAPARLLARRASGGRVSVLVLQAEGARALALLGARGTLLPGEELEVAGDRWRVVAALGEGRFELQVVAGREFARLMEEAGRMPLPPYIERDAEADPRDALDRERYQTVFARGPACAVAAPTAGLHFTPELLAALEARGVVVERLTLEVGEGTFRPLRGETLDGHAMHAERYEIPASLAAAFAAARAGGGRVVAVGTTVVRALESRALDDAAGPGLGCDEGPARGLRPGPGTTSLFIRPGFRFRAVDALLTNFHQPRSTLLVLVSAFAGRETVRAAYAHALRSGYRLFSYGDAMLLR